MSKKKFLNGLKSEKINNNIEFRMNYMDRRNTIGSDSSEPSTSNQTGENPIAPPRTRRASSNNPVLSTETLSDIQAANAISGGVQANQDLPYMTPPLLMLLPHPPQTQRNNHQPEHFSGDSQDSSAYLPRSIRTFFKFLFSFISFRFFQVPRRIHFSTRSSSTTNINIFKGFFLMGFTSFY